RPAETWATRWAARSRGGKGSGTWGARTARLVIFPRVFCLVRSSHLDLACVDGCLPGACPRVKPVASTGFGRVCRLWWRAVGGLDDGEGEFLELGEQGAELFGVVEQWLPGGELLGGEPAGGGLAADLAGPFGVGAVPGGRAGVAAAAGLAAFVGAHDQGAGQGGAGCRGELGGDLGQGLLLPGGWVHAAHRLRSMAVAGGVRSI